MVYTTKYMKKQPRKPAKKVKVKKFSDGGAVDDDNLADPRDNPDLPRNKYPGNAMIKQRGVEGGFARIRKTY